MTVGPIQLVVIGFDEATDAGKIVKELRDVREKGIIRLIDFLFIAKYTGRNIVSVKMSDLSDEEAVRFGAVVGGLLGFGASGTKEGAEFGALVGALEASEYHFGLTGDDMQTIADRIPDNSSAIIALYEHTWAKKLRETIRDAGGYTVAQGIVRPEALIELGAELSAALEAAEQEEAGQA
jgi:uncharacterized membrane protein